MASFVRPYNGRAQLVKDGKIVQTFGINVSNAMMQGSEIVVTLDNGKTQIWRLNNSGNGANLYKTL